MGVKLGVPTLRRNMWFRAFADMAMDRIRVYGENSRILEKGL